MFIFQPGYVAVVHRKLLFCFCGFSVTACHPPFSFLSFVHSLEKVCHLVKNILIFRCNRGLDWTSFFFFSKAVVE